MALVGKNSEKNNQNLMQLIRRAHGLVENPDLEKHRQSQDHIGELLGNSKEIQYRPVDIDGMDAEWVSVNRAHMKKYVILHCHGGGYSTGSSIYARTLTSKLAAGTSMDVLCFDYRLAPEHPYPAAAEDAMKAWNYLMLLGYGARDVIITGDSAGGNLALSLVLKLKEQERLFPRGIVLMSPWTDLTGEGKTFQTKADYAAILDRMAEVLGDDRARQFHVHFSRIEYSAGGEKRHWTFADTQFGPEPQPLMELLAQRQLTPVVICESAGTQAEDAQTMQQMYCAARNV